MNTQLRLDVATFDVSEDADISTVVNIEDGSIIGLFTDDSWDTAVITVLVSFDGTTFFPIYDINGNELEIEFDSNQFVSLNPSLIPGVQKVKLQSGTTAVPVDQSGDVAVTIVSRRV